jgi:hypothetical protein
MARRVSGLLKGGASRLTIRFVLWFAGSTSQTALGASACMFFIRGTVTPNGNVRSNFPAMNARMAVERLRIPVPSLSGIGPEFFGAVAQDQIPGDILAEGRGDIGGAMQPPPQGVWGMPAETLRALPGNDPDVGKNRAEGRKLMEKAGYGPDKTASGQGVRPQYSTLSRSRRRSD